MTKEERICKNCKYYHSGTDEKDYLACFHPEQCADDSYVGVWLDMKPDDFCSRFEKK